MTEALSEAKLKIPGYEITRILGAGGMGSVYLAKDEVLRRNVAIKFISESSKLDGAADERFLREARAMATLQVPHIVRIYGFGEVDGTKYIVMEYVEGRSLADRIRLDGRLATKEALVIVSEVVWGLEAAWKKGFVHRDIKPSNILLDQDGHVHIADFGLVKTLEDKELNDLSVTGNFLGTPHYVSPEQALGKELDFHSDIYSLGIVLYEMLSGAPPFRGTTPFAVVQNHLQSPLPSLKSSHPEIPEGVLRLLEKMTQKDALKRPSSYAEIHQELERLLLSAATTMKEFARPARRFSPITLAIFILLVVAIGTFFVFKGKPHSTTQERKLPQQTKAAPAQLLSLAILPFKNQTGDASLDYLGVGLADAVTRSMTASSGLVVRPITSVLNFEKVDPLTAGKSLAVDRIVDGILLKSGNKIRISLQLLDCRESTAIWNREMESAQKDLFELEDKMAVALSTELEGELNLKHSPLATRVSTRNADAYFNYMEGRERLLRTETGDMSYKNLQDAESCFNKAIEIDPNYAPPYASYAMALDLMVDWGYRTDRKVIEQALSLAQRSIEIDDKQAEGYIAAAQVHSRLGNISDQFQELKKALQLEPNNALLHRRIGVFYFGTGNWDASLKQCEIMKRLDPTDVYSITQPAIFQLHEGQYRSAANVFEKLPGYEVFLMVAYAGLGENAKAKQLVDQGKGTPISRALVCAMLGDRGCARKELGREAFAIANSDSGQSYFLGCAYAQLGDHEKALQWLRKSVYDQGWKIYPAYEKDPTLDPLRSDPRFQQLLPDMKATWQADMKKYELN